MRRVFFVGEVLSGLKRQWVLSCHVSVVLDLATWMLMAATRSEFGNVQRCRVRLNEVDCSQRVLEFCGAPGLGSLDRSSGWIRAQSPWLRERGSCR